MKFDDVQICKVQVLNFVYLHSQLKIDPSRIFSLSSQLLPGHSALYSVWEGPGGTTEKDSTSSLNTSKVNKSKFEKFETEIGQCWLKYWNSDWTKIRSIYSFWKISWPVKNHLKGKYFSCFIDWLMQYVKKSFFGGKHIMLNFSGKALGNVELSGH